MTEAPHDTLRHWVVELRHHDTGRPDKHKEATSPRQHLASTRRHASKRALSFVQSPVSDESRLKPNGAEMTCYYFRQLRLWCGYPYLARENCPNFHTCTKPHDTSALTWFSNVVIPHLSWAASRNVLLHSPKEPCSVVLFRSCSCKS